MTFGWRRVVVSTGARTFAQRSNERRVRNAGWIEPLQIAYVEDLWNPEMRICKLWFTGRIIGGELTSLASGSAAENIVDARFVGRDEFRSKVIFPEVLRDQYWEDRSGGFTSTRYLGIREMETY